MKSNRFRVKVSSMRGTSRRGRKIRSRYVMTLVEPPGGASRSFGTGPTRGLVLPNPRRRMAAEGILKPRLQAA